MLGLSLLNFLYVQIMIQTLKRGTLQHANEHHIRCHVSL